MTYLENFSLNKSFNKKIYKCVAGKKIIHIEIQLTVSVQLI